MSEKITVMTMEGSKEMTRAQYEAFMDECKVKKSDRVPVQPTLEKATKEQKAPVPQPAGTTGAAAPKAPATPPAAKTPQKKK